MKNLTELEKVTKKFIKVYEDALKEKGKPKIKTVRDLEGRGQCYYINAKGQMTTSFKPAGHDYSRIFLTREEAQKRALRDQIECELDCDSRIAWGESDSNQQFFIDWLDMDGFILHLDWNGKQHIFGLFGAVNFPTKESLIESINTHRELLNQYFDVDSFEVV